VEASLRISLTRIAESCSLPSPKGWCSDGLAAGSTLGAGTCLGTQAYAHVCSTVPNFMVLESKYSYRDESYRKLTTDSDYRDGFLHVPDTPGIGIEVREDAVKDLLMPAILHYPCDGCGRIPLVRGFGWNTAKSPSPFLSAEFPHACENPSTVGMVGPNGVRSVGPNGIRPGRAPLGPTSRAVREPPL